MQYFRHSELANMYHVSLKTVHNWIDASKQGKTQLKLHQTNNRTYIANTQENILILQQLSEKGKKYRNSLHSKIIQPKPEFYEVYSPRQIMDIITNLSVHHEIPRLYNYFGDGAHNWENWLKRLSEEQSPNILRGTLELLHTNLPIIDQLIENKKRINVIDLGVGNAYPVRELLGHLLDKQVLHRYIAIDVSPSMLEVAERNIKNWYGDSVKFEGYVRDLSYERFDDLLVDDILGDSNDETINLALLFGGTPVNSRSFDEIFRVVHGSMSGSDLLIYTDKPDTESARQYFDFNSAPDFSKLSPNHNYILELMNIDESLYDAEMGYDPDRRMRYVRIRLKAAITIEFDFKKSKRLIRLEKGDTILLLRALHLTAIEMISTMEKTGLSLLHSNLSQNRQFFLSISYVKPDVQTIEDPR